MIGGYLYSRADSEVDARLHKVLGNGFHIIELGDIGCLFYDEPFIGKKTEYCASDELIALSQDLLVQKNADGNYIALDIEKGFPAIFLKKGADSFNEIVSDFRMAVIDKRGGKRKAFLVSNRAGAGRIFYHILETGILFASDLRLLMKIIPCRVSKIGLYAMLKYGAIPEPLTISEDVSAVPPAHYLKYDLQNNQSATNAFYKFSFVYGDGESPLTDIQERLTAVKETLKSSARLIGGMQPVMLLSGGIDSSLYACYLHDAGQQEMESFYCVFGEGDPEYPYARQIAERIDARFHVGDMKQDAAIPILEEVVRLTDHPFSDFSSLPVTFILKFIKESLPGAATLVECNGGDDCFGFPALGLQKKYTLKHRFPEGLKAGISSMFKPTSYWKWESHEGFLARISALADVHEIDPFNYFLVSAPLNYLDLNADKGWDQRLTAIMGEVFSDCDAEYGSSGYHAKTTIRQLLHINSRKWTAKAHSVGEGLGIRVVYPFIWRDILTEQGKLPWNAKIYNGIVKWPLKRLLEEYMPKEFIYRNKSGFVPPFVLWLTDREFNHKVRDILFSGAGSIVEIFPQRILEELLTDALDGKKLRAPILNTLWAAIFTEMWIQRYR